MSSEEKIPTSIERQRIGRLIAEKTPLYRGPGGGPADIVTSFLNPCEYLTKEGKLCGLGARDEPFTIQGENCTSQCQGPVCVSWLTSLLENLPEFAIINEQKVTLLSFEISVTNKEYSYTDGTFSINFREPTPTWRGYRMDPIVERGKWSKTFKYSTNALVRNICEILSNTPSTHERITMRIRLDKEFTLSKEEFKLINDNISDKLSLPAVPVMFPEYPNGYFAQTWYWWPLSLDNTSRHIQADLDFIRA